MHRPDTAHDQHAINEQEWRRPENWRGLLGSYSSPRDTRLWVPKSTPALGWTLNFAHRAAYWTLVGLLIPPLGVLLLLLLLTIAR